MSLKALLVSHLLVLAVLSLPIQAGPAPLLQKIGSVPRVEPSADAEQGVVLEWSTPEGQEYWYRLPKTSRGSRKPALLLMLHGTGLDHGWSFWNYPIASNEFRGDDIVISPDGLTSDGSTFNFIQGSQDREQIAGLIEFFRSRFEIGNVYLYGHSQGAFFCYWFAGEHPELVDGIVAHAGNVLDNVRHPKLAKERVAIGILHTRADPVVPVECAQASEKVYREQGYEKLKCWIVEGIREEAGHWPLPTHVSEMLAWLDSVCVQDAAQAVQVATAALLRNPPDLPTAVRATADARAMLKKYRAADADAVTARIALLERGLILASETIWAQIGPALAAHDNGKLPGTYAGDLRWAQRELSGLPAFETNLKPFSALIKKHAKELARLAKAKDREEKRYAKDLAKTLAEAWLAPDWDGLHAVESKRVAGGWDPTGDLQTTLEQLGEQLGSGPTEGLVTALVEALAKFSEANPALAGVE